MRTTCSLSTLLWVCISACADSPQPSARPPIEKQSTAQPATGQQNAARGPSVVVSGSNENGRTRLELQIGESRRDVVLLARDSTVSPDAEPRSIDVVAEVPGVAILLVDGYSSLPGGLSRCQAGEEQFLRVIAIASAKAAETFMTKVASCRDNIELADPGIRWDALTSTLRVHWLSGPKGEPEVRTMRLGSDGRPQRAQ